MQFFDLICKCIMCKHPSIHIRNCEKTHRYNRTSPSNSDSLLTIIAVSQDGDLGSWVVGSQLAAHGHAEADIEALFLLIQRVIDDDDATEFLPLILVKTEYTVVVLWAGDVVRVGQHSAGYGASGRG